MDFKSGTKVAKHPARLLTRILADPALPEKLWSLEPTALARMIEEVGLEDSGELVALASTQQLERVFDEDLWNSPRPGADEAFNANRFGLWIEILLELGADRAADKLVEMDRDFVTMAISQLIWAIDFDSLRTEVAHEQRLEKVMDSASFIEIEDYVIFSREPSTWDAVLTLLTTLDQKHYDFLRNLLERRTPKT